ncbi:hypothetical protein [Aestuariicoccus sp. MJ-SS9]|uniref:hypothetical protein n=1 Tax=Aestuariicoccus sp. MJ-SS9 TaxID=3079855 RepID=UPI00290D4B1B|nr:hypothetical protein [Aestuariicoccus sp. MJ-SS9]MDU8910052.1 hypothetical protein [Aestuariicoccus sp. MJ-SS9]
MYAMPTSDQTAVWIDDADADTWGVHYLSFDPLEDDSFETDSFGNVLAAAYNPANEAVWILGEYIQAVSREKRAFVGIPFPEDGLVPFDLKQIGHYIYLCCAQANVWAFNRTINTWEPRLQPGPKPDIPSRDAAETAADYVDRTYPMMDRYAMDNPGTYGAFGSGDAHYVVGALGRVIRWRGDTPDQMWLDSGVRLIHGHDEDGQIVLCGDRPVAEIYRGTMDDGFELIFTDDERALHMTARQGGVRYIGAGIDEEYDGPGLFRLEDGELIPEVTGCAREPGQLLQLVSTGAVLWAIDQGGIFRLVDGEWQLTEFEDI